MFKDLLEELGGWTDGVRGRLSSNFDIASFTWFRVGGPAQLFFNPADEADLAYFLQHLPQEVPRHHDRAWFESAGAGWRC